MAKFMYVILNLHDYKYPNVDGQAHLTAKSAKDAVLAENPDWVVDQEFRIVKVSLPTRESQEKLKKTVTKAEKAKKEQAAIDRKVKAIEQKAQQEIDLVTGNDSKSKIKTKTKTKGRPPKSKVGASGTSKARKVLKSKPKSKGRPKSKK